MTTQQLGPTAGHSSLFSFVRKTELLLLLHCLLLGVRYHTKEQYEKLAVCELFKINGIILMETMHTGFCIIRETSATCSTNLAIVCVDSTHVCTLVMA